MENWGLVTYREVDLLCDPQKASNQQKQRVCTVVTHELAHQWFGNLVTMAWWDDLWLNEGFASWAENWCADEIHPNYKMWDQFTTGHLSAAMRLDAMKSSHPIQVPIRHAEEVRVCVCACVRADCELTWCTLDLCLPVFGYPVTYTHINASLHTTLLGGSSL